MLIALAPDHTHTHTHSPSMAPTANRALSTSTGRKLLLWTPILVLLSAAKGTRGWE